MISILMARNQVLQGRHSAESFCGRYRVTITGISAHQINNFKNSQSKGFHALNFKLFPSAQRLIFKITYGLGFPTARG